MLTIHIKGRELWNPSSRSFHTVKSQTIALEHSLVSVSKWEAKWKKAFLSKREKTNEEILDYIRCMIVTQNVDPNIFYCLSQEQIKAITDYVNDPMTATVINSPDDNAKQSRDVVTSELIYYWMISCNIPFECQKWHLNRLMTLIRVCSIKNAPPKKQKKRDILRNYASINAARRQRMGSKG